MPFSFIPCAGAGGPPKPPSPVTRVKAIADRINCEITFPRVLGYRYELPSENLVVTFNEESKYTLSTADIPSKTENAPIVGESVIHTLDDLKQRRPQEVAFLLAKLTLEKYFRDNDGNIKQWLFPQLLDITKRWVADCVVCKDNTFTQMLLLIEFAHNAADRIYHSIVTSEKGQKAIMPILQPYNTVGSTRYVDFDTSKPVYPTDARFCHVSHVVADTQSWEQKMAQALEELGEEGLVCCYVKNQNLNFTIPYTINGEEHNYLPDFIAKVDDGHGKDNLLNLIIEVTGEKKKDKEAKVSTAKDLWIPAVNNYGQFGRWAFIEIADPWDAKNTIRAAVKKISDLKSQISEGETR